MEEIPESHEFGLSQCYDFENTCRSCLSEDVVLDLCYFIHEGNLLSEIYEALTLVQINEDDELPHKLCSSCADFIMQYYSFMKRAWDSENVLQKARIKKDGKISSESTNEIDNSGVVVVVVDDGDKIINLKEKITVGNCDNSEIELTYESEEVSENSNFICSLCGQTFETFAEYKIHRKKEAKQRFKRTRCLAVQQNVLAPKLKGQFKCGICEKKFVNTVSLKKHSLIHKGIKKGLSQGSAQRGQASQRSFKCSFCGKTFISGNAFESHINTAHNSKQDLSAAESNNLNLNCHICQKGFNSRRNLRNHMHTHMEKKYLCSKCGQKFSTKLSLNKHSKVHTGAKPYICEICKKAFAEKSNLRAHILTHTGERPESCSICGKRFSQKAHLTYHMRTHSDRNICTVHNVEKNWAATKQKELNLSCQICDNSFSTEKTLRYHMSIHMEKKYLCSACGQKFSTKPLLDSHSKVHTGVKPYSCEICNKAFAQKGTLNTHILTHTGEKPVVCRVCGKRFSQNAHLTYHMRTHSGERPYTCSYCGKAFTHTGYLKVHTRMHTGEKPFVCDICSRGFYDSSSMKRHRKTHGMVKIETEIAPS